MSKDSITTKLQELFDLLKSGAIDQEEYDLLKAELLQKNEITIPSSSKKEAISNERKIKDSTENSNNNIAEEELPVKKLDEKIEKKSKYSAKSFNIRKTERGKFRNVLIGLFLIILIGSGIWIVSKLADTNKSNKIDSDLYKMNIVGKVKSLTEFFDYKVEDDMGEDQDNKITYNFNKFGNIENQSNYVDTKKLLNKITYTYNKENQLIESKMSFNGQNKEFKTFYIYNEQNQIIQTKQQDIKALADTIFNYDIAGNLTTKNVRDEYLGEYLITYEYDENNQKIKERYGDGNHNDYSYSYDEKGRLNEISTYYNKIEVLVRKNKYSYDSRNNIINEENGTFDWVRNKSIEQPSEWSEYKYDIIYDKKGNWIKKSKSIDGEIYIVQTREIEYY